MKFTGQNSKADHYIEWNDDRAGDKSCRVDKLQQITIIGKNGARIVGCDVNRKGYHPVLNETQEMVGDFWGWRTLQISLPVQPLEWRIGRNGRFFCFVCRTRADDHCFLALSQSASIMNKSAKSSRDSEAVRRISEDVCIKKI